MRPAVSDPLPLTSKGPESIYVRHRSSWGGPPPPPSPRIPRATQSRWLPEAPFARGRLPASSMPSSVSSPSASNQETSARKFASSPPTLLPETLVFDTPPMRNARFSSRAFCALASSWRPLGPVSGPTRLQHRRDGRMLCQWGGASVPGTLRSTRPSAYKTLFLGLILALFWASSWSS